MAASGCLNLPALRHKEIKIMEQYLVDHGADWLGNRPCDRKCGGIAAAGGYRAVRGC
jgi:hypothetical protein